MLIAQCIFSILPFDNCYLDFQAQLKNPTE